MSNHATEPVNLIGTSELEILIHRGNVKGINLLCKDELERISNIFVKKLEAMGQANEFNTPYINGDDIYETTIDGYFNIPELIKHVLIAAFSGEK